MKNLEIQKVRRIENETGLLCYDDCIATIAGYFSCSYELMYLGGYSITGQSGNKKFASQYRIYLKDQYKNLEQYHGLYFTECTLLSDKVEELRNELKKQKPCLIIFDPYWCPWDLGFQKYTNLRGHSFFVVEEKGNSFVCVDPYFNKNAIEISKEHFVKGVRKIMQCNRKQSNVYMDSEIFSNVKKMFEGLYENKYFESLTNLAYDIEYSDNIFNEIVSSGEFWYSPIIVLFLLINQSMQSMALVIEYILRRFGNKYPVLIGVDRKIWNIAIQWKQVRKLIIKLYFMKKSDEELKKKIVERMRDIILKFEEESTKIIEFERTSMMVRHVANDTLSQNMPQSMSVKLDTYFNNKAFLQVSDLKKNKVNVDFSSIGNCYVADAIDVSFFGKKNRNINLDRILSPSYDNVACNGQRIMLPDAIYKKILLIGAAEFGNSIDILTIQTKIGDTIEIEIQFTDYIYKPQFNEKIFWAGKGIHKLENKYEWMQETLYLFEKEYDIPRETISSITLPINPSIHIFAINLVN